MLLICLLLCAIEGSGRQGCELELCLSLSLLFQHQPNLTTVSVMQIERAFMDAWETAAGQLTNPKASPDDLELAAIEPEDAWQQLQDSTGVAAGAVQQTLEATKFAHSKGKLCFAHTQCIPLKQLHSLTPKTSCALSTHTQCIRCMLRSNKLAQADSRSQQRMPDGRSHKTVAAWW